jgi:hypothetical protein
MAQAIDHHGQWGGGVDVKLPRRSADGGIVDSPLPAPHASLMASLARPLHCQSDPTLVCTSSLPYVIVSASAATMWGPVATLREAFEIVCAMSDTSDAQIVGGMPSEVDVR